MQQTGATEVQCAVDPSGNLTTVLVTGCDAGCEVSFDDSDITVDIMPGSGSDAGGDGGGGDGVVVTLDEGPSVVAVEGEEDDEDEAVGLGVDEVTVSPLGSEPVTQVAVTFVVSAEALATSVGDVGGAKCALESLSEILFGSGGGEGCVAGCCKEGGSADGGRGCECDDEARGPHCEYQLRCSAESDDDGTAGGNATRSTDECSTSGGGVASAPAGGVRGRRR